MGNLSNQGVSPLSPTEPNPRLVKKGRTDLHLCALRSRQLTVSEVFFRIS